MYTLTLLYTLFTLASIILLYYLLKTNASKRIKNTAIILIFLMLIGLATIGLVQWNTTEIGNTLQKEQLIQDKEIKTLQTEIDTLGAQIQIHKQKQSNNNRH